MAELSNPARANTRRRKVTGQMSMSSAPSQPSSSSSVGASGEPRLKARINPANIVGGSGSAGSPYATPPAARPTTVRAPSSTSGRSDTGGRSTPRSDVGGPSSARTTPALGQRPLVARAASANNARVTPPPSSSTRRDRDSSSVPHSGTSTPTGGTHVHVRRASSFVSRTTGTTSGSGSGGAGRSPQLDQGQFIPHGTTGPPRLRHTAPSGTGTGVASSDSETPGRGTHGRSSSFQPGPRSDSGSSALSSTAPTTSPKLSGYVSPPSGSQAIGGGPHTKSRQLSNDSTSSRPTVRSNTSSPSMVPPLSLGTDTARLPTRPPEPPRLSSLHEVSASSENLTQYLAPQAGVSSSLLSPSTLVPHVASPPTISHEVHDDDEREPSSNHSSPARANRHLGATTPLHTHFAHLGLGPLAAASAPTSPGGSPRRAQMGLGFDDTPSLHRRRPSHLPWNPNHGPAPVFPPTPSSPELRTVALPIMTPVRSPEGSEHTPLPVPGSRRYSSSSDASATAAVTGPRISSSPLAQVAPITSNGGRDASAAAGGWSGYMSRDDKSSDDERDRDDDDEDAERRQSGVGLELNENSLERVLSSDMDLERDKWERKIADLEISNASLLKINRMLEAQKAKQGSELVRLRRALRDARSGLGPLEKSSLAVVTSAEDEPDPVEADTSGSWGDDEMEDPELEKRWDRLRDMVGAMRQRGEDAIERGREQHRPGVQRVLGWLEVEAALGGAAGGARGATPALQSASTSQMPSRAASDTDPTEVSTPATAVTPATSHN